MTFKPNTRDLETIALLTHARATTAQIAAALGIFEAAVTAWRGRLAAGRAWACVEPM